MSLPVIDLLSLFPDSLRSILDSSILRRAQAKELVELATSDLRSFAKDKHRSVDDSPYGGDQGMLFKAPVLEAALQAQLQAVGGDRSRLKVIYPHPRGLHLRQYLVQGLVDWLMDEAQASPASENQPNPSSKRIVVICGRYEGIDERIVDRWVDLEISLGDFILTGAELPALTLCDAMVRLIPGVLGNERSAEFESFSSELLEHPQYTRPRDFMGLEVPAVLSGGNHRDVEEWKLREAILLTAAFRPDLIRRHTGRGLPYWAKELVERLQKRLDLRDL